MNRAAVKSRALQFSVVENNMRKGIVAVIALVAVVASAGVGYAAFSSSANVVVNASAGTFALQWSPTGSASVVLSHYYVGCLVSVAPSTITMTIAELAPGDSCTIPLSDGIVLQNTGSLPGTVVVTSFNPSSCGFYQDTGFVLSPYSIPGFGAIGPQGAYEFTAGITSGTSACAGLSTTMTWTFTGNAGT